MPSVQTPLHIFVSHSNKDNEFTTHLVGDLRTHFGASVDVWHDISGGLQGGDSWWNVIVDKMNECDIFLLVLSPSALQSKAVEVELNMAWTRKFTGKTQIIPLLYETCETRLDLATLQYISFLVPKTYETAFQDLTHVLFVSESYRQRRDITPEGDIPSTTIQPHATILQRIHMTPLILPSLLIFSIAAGQSPRQVLVSQASFTIGRDLTNDVIIPDAFVSRRHLLLEHAGEIWVVACQPEAGLLYVNGQQCTKSVLHSGDQIVIGGTVLRFELPTLEFSKIDEAATINTRTMLPHLTVDCEICHFVVPLREPILSLGRGPDNTIVIPSQLVSTHHAQLHQLPSGAYRIQDSNSRNGLTHNGKRVQQHRLRSGDRISIDAGNSSQKITLSYATTSL